MGMKAVRMSRKDHPMPTTGAVSARVAATYSDGQRPQKSVASHDKDSMVPKKMWPRGDVSEWTSPPSPHARDGKEGPKRGRQADKSSKSK